MNKFGRFLGRILAQICLKMDYFGSKSQKIASAGAPPPDLRSGSMTRGCAKLYSY